MIEEKVFQDKCIAFHNEWVKNKIQPAFDLLDKTIVSDIASMTNVYVEPV
jgi:hypothetical protein